MYITPQSSLKPTDGITRVLLLLMLHSDKNTFFYIHNWLHTIGGTPVSLDIYSTSYLLSDFYPETQQI